MSKLQPPRGTHDLFFMEQKKHRHIVEKGLKVASTFGFHEMSTPIFESTSVFKRSLGDASDIVNKEMYTFEDRGGTSVTLRPEGTAGIARSVVSGGLTREVPLKFFYSGPMFRYERPQKGRQRQFHQLGVELIGVENPVADTEIVQIAHEFLDQLGLIKKVTLELNSIGDKESRDSFRAALISYLEQYKSDLSEDSLKRLSTNPLRILDSKSPGDQKVIEGAPSLSDHLNDSSRLIFDKIRNNLTALNINYVHNQKLVRGLDYYNHLVFEFTTTHLGSQNAVLAGGRYDQLIAMMGGPNLPGVGWASGMERLALMLEQEIPSKAPIYICPLGNEAETKALQIGHLLRENEIVEITYSGNLGKRMKKANAASAKAAIIIGDTELETDSVLVKILSTGEQKAVSVDQLKKFFSDL